MDDNKTQNPVQKAAEAGQKAKQAVQDAKTVGQIATKIAANDYLGAAVDALKSGIIKRNFKYILINLLMQILIPAIIAGCLFSVINSIKDEMINLIASVAEAAANFLEDLWKNITDDYWLDLNEKTKYVVDKETGESLAYYKGDNLVLVQKGITLEEVNAKIADGKTEEREYTLVDEYVKDLGNRGVKLSGLRLLGNEEVTNFDELLQDEKKKTIVEKYISEFMRADIITQQVHRKKRSGDLVKISETENLVDGGIYVYRHKESNVTIEEGDFNNSSGKTSLGKIIFVGDSRTVDMFTEVDYKDGNYFSTTEDGIDIYAMDGAGFDFLKDTINAVGDYDTLAVWLGANDKGNFSKYESYYEDLLTSGKKLILFDVGEIIDSVASVSPKLTAEQKEIYKDSYVTNYNNAMNNWAESKRLNENKDVELDMTTYSGYGDTIPFVDTTSDDGVHYNPKPTSKIWEHIYNKISTTYFNSDKDDDNNGENAGEGTSTEEIQRIEKLDYTDLELMEYIEYEDFIKKIQDANGKTSIPSDLRLQFSINPKTDELVVAQIDEETVVEDSYNKEDLILPENLHQWFADRSGTTTYKVTEKPFKYKDKISKYAMPYEFLINLCEVTQNPEFVYHVALLARDTQIALVVNDNTSTVTETEDHEIVEKTYTNHKDSSRSGAEITNTKTKRERKMTVSKEQNPILELYFADTWSFYEKFKYTRTITATLTKETTEGDTDNPLPSTLDGPFTKPKSVDENSVPKPGEDEEKYWQSTFVTAHTITKSILDEVSEISDPEVEQSIEKSKQFLGLLRNKKGKCSESDCYDESSWKNKTDPAALKCARNAVFNEEGKNVSYRIPTMTKKEMPYNKLMSGLEILYAAMQSNSSGFDKDDLLVDTSKGQFADNNKGYKDYSGAYEMQEEAKAEGTWEGYEDSYVIKMQGLVEHIKYLMGFPPNEGDYDSELDTNDTEDDIVDDINDFNPDDFDGKIDYGDLKDKITEDDLYLFYQLCEAEAGGSSEDEIGHVASVVLNRVLSSQFPNTIREVILAKRQFEPVTTGKIYKMNPTEKTKKAVDYVLANGDTTGGAIFFKVNKSIQVGETEEGWGLCILKDPNGHAFYTTAVALEELLGKPYTSIIDGQFDPNVQQGDNHIGWQGTYTFMGKTYKNWKQFPLNGSGGEGWTKWLKNSGCGLTSASIVLSSISDKYTPYYLYFYENGRNKQGHVSIPTYIKDAGGSTTVAKSLDDVKKALLSGKPVIMCLVGSASIDGESWAGSSGHYIVLNGISNDGSTVHVSNPGAGNHHKNGDVLLSKFSGKVNFAHTYIVNI